MPWFKKEIQETNYWLKIVNGSDMVNNENNKHELTQLLNESEELIRIIGAILHSSKNK